MLFIYDLFSEMFKKFEFNHQKLSPLRQGAFTLLLITIVSIFCLVTGQKSVLAWNMIFSPIFLFCFYNPIIGAFQQKLLQYIGISVIVFILLSGYIYFSGNFVSDLSYRQTNELHTITILVVLFYFLFTLLCLLFRGILFILKEIDN